MQTLRQKKALQQEKERMKRAREAYAQLWSTKQEVKMSPLIKQVLGGFLGILLGLAIVYLGLRFAYGQDKFFPLNTPIADKAVVCVEKDVAVALVKGANTPLQGVILQSALRTGQCFVVEGMMTYTQEVHEENGWRVYEVRFAERLWFVATTWKAKSEKI